MLQLTQDLQRTADHAIKGCISSDWMQEWIALVSGSRRNRIVFSDAQSPGFKLRIRIFVSVSSLTGLIKSRRYSFVS